MHEAILKLAGDLVEMFGMSQAAAVEEAERIMGDLTDWYCDLDAKELY